MLLIGEEAPSPRAPEATHTMRRRIRTTGVRQNGQGVSEYVVMLALIVMLIVGTVHLVATNAKNAFSRAASALQHQSNNSDTD